ncbi:MAG: DUF4402 domain-containing protein [Flavobacteriaceae bacterium]|nr:DUF4402 domain-containing protein [Flavobacteriaceae bacterium]
MKKITFILFALIAGTTFAQNTDNGTATASASIVSAITIADGTTLNFGKILKGTAGTVAISTAGLRSVTGVTEIVGTAVSASTFVVNASDGYVYDVTFIPSITLTNGSTATGTKTMTVDTFIHDAGVTPTGTGADQNLNVGATLHVVADQVEGNYSGTASVTVTYQ